MRKDLTDITLVVDRSGSMASRREEAQGGVNSFIDKQKGEDGEAVLTLLQFDTEHEMVHDGVPITEVGEYELEPRGMTALLDAVGMAITTAKGRRKATAKADRAGLVVFVIVTDGLENASHEYSKEQVKALIEKQRDSKGWQFVYLGAGHDAFEAAGGMGIGQASTGGYVPDSVGAAYGAASDSVGRMRGALAMNGPIDPSFTDEQRKKMAGKTGK